MPTYVYRCKKCENAFEEVQKITADALKDCPSCSEKSSLERVPSGGNGLLFNGTGYYITDYGPLKRESKEGCGGPCSCKGE